MSDKILSFISGMFTDRAPRTALISFLLSVAVIAVAVAITTNSFQGFNFTNRIPDTERWYFLTGFCILFPTIWFIMHLQTQVLFGDAYTEVRQKLRGNWVIKYEAYTSVFSREIIVPERMVTCSIQEDTVRKLQFRFSMIDNPIFTDNENEIIRDVAIRDNEQGGYTIFYYYLANRRLISKYTDLMLENSSSRDQIEVEIFGRISFPNPSSSNHVKEMVGKWYDLNGNMMRIMTMIDLHRQSLLLKKTFEPLDFNDIAVHKGHFDSDMGTVRFMFQGAA